MIEISKELLSEVIGEKRAVLDYEVSINKTEIHYGHKDIDYDGFINIYELAHRCKVWAFVNGYYLTIYNDAVDIVLKTNCKVIKNITDGSFNYSPMLVFKACQWILDNKYSK